MRILMVTPRCLPEIGGVERHVFEVSRRLAAGGHEVTVLATDRSGRLPAEEIRSGVRVRRVRAWPARADLYLAPAIAREVHLSRCDLVHVQSYHTLVAPLAMLAATRAQRPYVITLHGGGHSSHLRNALRGPQRRVLRPLLTGARRIIAVAPFEVELYGRELGLDSARFAVIPNGLDPPVQLPPVARSHPIVASVGRLERYKGHQRAIRALPHVLEREPEVRLWIAGSGPYEPALRRLARRLRVADRVEISAVPADDRRAMASRLATCALVVLLSEFETHPLAALEARAAGRPLLVADAPGLRQLADSGQARAVPLRAPPARIAAAIVEQLRTPFAAPPPPVFTWDDCAAELADLYRTAVACAS